MSPHRSQLDREAPESPAVEALPPADPVLLSADLAAWAGEAVAQGGRRLALLGKVDKVRLGADGRTIEGQVRGTGPYAYRVDIAVEGGALVSACSCGDQEHAVCVHAVALLQAVRFPPPTLNQVKAAASRRPPPAGKAMALDRTVYALQGADQHVLGREDRVALAWDHEILDRRAAARRERAKVRRLAVEGPPTFGVSRRGGAEEVVVFRGVGLERASCTCADFAENELGTCKHVEKVRTWFSRRKRVPVPRFVSIWWCPREWPTQVPDPLQELRADLPGGEIPSELHDLVDESGWLREPPAGTARAAWLGQLRLAASVAAERMGLQLDLDPALFRWEARFAAEEANAAATGELGVHHPLWMEATRNLGFQLHPYQEEGALFLARRGRAFLADDMGLGKTVQAIVAALLLRRAAGAEKALVVCPASLKHQWRREIEKACGERAVVVEGPRAQRAEAYRSFRGGFLVINYELVLKDLEVLRAGGLDLVVLDEAQRIKNWDTKTAQAVKQLETPFAFILTGTPLENRLVELHSLVEFLHPRALGPRWRLLPFHSVTDPRGRVLAYEGLDVLRERLRGFFLRRERRTVLHQLPDRTDNAFWTGMTLAQRRPYREHAATVASLLQKSPVLGPMEVRRMLRALTSMRILCNAYAQYAWDRFEPRVTSGEPATEGDLRLAGSPKLEELCHVFEDLLEEQGAKVVVFSQWERMLRLAHWALRGQLDARGARAEVFHGGLDSRARGRMLEEFRDDPTFRVLLSTDAGGLGLNLQEAASIVVNLEVPWNPAVLEQRIGRVHRIGQVRGVRVLHFVTKGAIEERVLRVVEGKRALFEGLLADEADTIVFDPTGRDSFVEQVRTLVTG